MQRSVAIDHVKAVAAIDDPVLRNLWISLTYADLSLAVRERVGVDNDASWCTFGSWASNTVGNTIRMTEGHETLRDRIRRDRQLHHAHKRAAGGHLTKRMSFGDLLHPRRLADLVLDLAGDAGAHLADGNQLVFEEIGMATARWIEIVDTGGPLDAQREAMARFCADASPAFGKNRLALGCDLLFDARNATDAVLRSEIMLTSSIELGLHEQTRLQPAISATFGVAVHNVIDPLVEESLGPVSRVGLVKRWLRDRVEPIEDRLGKLWDEALTELVLTFEMAGETLHLGSELPDPPGTDTLYPPRLADPTFPALVDALQQFDRSDGSGDNIEAQSWVDLRDRMSYILNMFRSRQCRDQVYQVPFTNSQIAELERNRVPTDL